MNFDERTSTQTVLRRWFFSIELLSVGKMIRGRKTSILSKIMSIWYAKPITLIQIYHHRKMEMDMVR